MQDINNFSNLIEVRGRSFDQLRANMASIEVPCKLLQIEVLPNGSYVAFLAADRKLRKVKERQAKEV